MSWDIHVLDNGAHPVKVRKIIAVIVLSEVMDVLFRSQPVAGFKVFIGFRV